MRKYLLLICLTLLAGAKQTSIAQHIGYKQYTVADGLAQSEVTCIHQDKKGFIWVGTKMGVSRFDGHKFETISDTSHILKSVVFQMRNLDDTTLVIFTSRGYALIMYDRKELNILSGRLDGHYSGSWIRKNKVEILTKTDSSVAVSKLDRAGLKETDFHFPAQFMKENFPNVGTFIEYSSQYDLFYYISNNGYLRAFRNDRVIDLRVSSLHPFIRGDDGNLYFLSPNPERSGVRLMKIADTVVSEVYNFGDVPNIPYYMTAVRDLRNFMVFRPLEYSFSFFRDGKEELFKIDHITGRCQLTDSEGNIWVGGPFGLTRLFHSGIKQFNKSDGFLPNSQCVFEDASGAILAGSMDHGLQLCRDGKFINIPLQNKRDPGMLVNIYPGGGLDHKGMVHLTAVPYSILRWDGKTVHYPDGYPVGGAFSFFEDIPNRTFYYGIDGGLLIQPENKDYSVVPVFPGNKRNKIVSIVQDKSNRLILGGFQGVSIYSEGEVIHLPTSEYPYNLGANAMAKDSRENIWIGNNDGLWFFDNTQFRKIENPFFNDFIASLFMAEQNTLFIGGLRGFGLMDLQKFYPSGRVDIRYYDRDNGFVGEECQQNAVTGDREGNIWFVTLNTLVQLDLKKLLDPTPAPRVYITSASLFTPGMDQIPLFTSAIESGNIEIPYDQNHIRIDFTGLCFRAPTHVRYRYILEGNQSDWSAPTADPYVVFSNLSPGRYRFRVMACNDNGAWSPNPAMLDIIIHHAIWQTWWFWALVSLFIAAFFFFLGLIFRNKKRKKEQEKLETEKRMAELQLISIRNQIDPHFTFNAINSIASVILKEEKEKAYSFFVKLSALIRQVLTSGDKITRKLSEELVFVNNYLEIEKLRFRDSFEFIIDIGEGLNLEQEVPKMVIQTYAENSLKHGLLNKKQGMGQLTIRLREEDGNLHITVEDNGIGRAAARLLGSKSTGRGMKILNFYYDFFDRYNKQKIHHEITDLVDDHHQPAGTRVTVIIPSGFQYQTTLHEPH